LVQLLRFLEVWVSDRIVLGDGDLSLDDVVAVARRSVPVALDEQGDLMVAARRSREALERHVSEGRPVYGVNTGFGGSCGNDIPAEALQALATNLPRYHQCGVGPMLDDEQSAAVVVVRLRTLLSGYSAVRAEVFDGLVGLLNHRICPRIPSRGSVGASGDLTPLAYVAAALVGEGRVSYRGGERAAAEALADAGLTPLRLGPKESLAIMNGTAVMSGLACLAWDRSHRLARLAAGLTAMLVETAGGQPGHFDERLFMAKPHVGQGTTAGWVRDALGCGSRPAHGPGRIQDPYSLRCAPHVIGVLVDGLETLRRWIEIEINSANDNPLVDPATGDVLHGGNFYGGHIGFVADSLKAAVASVVDLMDRQLVLLNRPSGNGGLPENLVAATGPDRHAHHGFKAMEITASALAAEALKQTMPATVFSRSTEGHNQDKVSMGSIAVLDWLRVLDLAEPVAAILLLALCQAADLRGGARAGGVRRLHETVRTHVEPLDGDRAMDQDIERVLALHREGALPLPGGAPPA
jgi:histidine ammonia-lyase